MKGLKTLALLTILLVAAVYSCRTDKGDLPKPASGGCDTTKWTYCSKCKKLFDAKCTSSGCHGLSSVNGDFTTYAGVKAKVSNGSLKIRVVIDKDMPSGDTLTQAQINNIDKWITAGAPEF